MADKRKSTYSIQLEIENADNVRNSITDIEKKLSAISESAKDSLGDGLKNANKEAEKLAEEIKNIAKNGEASKEQIEAYSKAANRTISDLEKQSSKLTYSLSEQGKAQRERLQALKSELQSLGNSREELKRKKELEKEIKSIQKDVVDGSDEELKNALKTNRATRATLKLAQQESKLLQAQAKQNKTLSELIKGDLKGLKEKIALQLKFIQTLKTTEGRYNAIKKVASKIGTGLAKAGAVGVGAVVGGAMGLAGAAVASANSQVDREREATRIKASLSDEEKQSLLGQLYTTTGADYTTIVDAINRVTSVLGTNAKADDLVQATTAEIRYPGAAAMFRQQNTKQANANDFAIYQNRLKAIQSASGASVDQVRASTEKIANMRQSSFSNASMTELQALYLGLQNSGAYDSQDELDRAFNSFVRNQKNSGQSVFDYAKEFDWTSRAYGATNKRQTINAMQNMDWNALANAAKTTNSETSMTAAEKTAMKMREMEEMKNKLLMKVLEALAPIIESIDVKDLSKFFESFIQIAKDIAPVIGKMIKMLFDVLNAVQPYISKLVTFMSETIGQLIDSVTALYEGIKNSKFGQWLGLADNNGGVSGNPHANGGLVTMPTLAGENGAEMVIPLDYSRRARADNLVQNLTQNFNMSGNESTLLSLSAAVRSREFARETGRLGYLNARMGR